MTASLDWIQQKEDVSIQHKFNGPEKKFGKYPIDGWDEVNNTAYQFHGCLWHGHEDLECPIIKKHPSGINPRNKKTFVELAKNTKKVTKYLKEKANVNLVEIFECQWNKMKTEYAEIAHFVTFRKVFRPISLHNFSIKAIESKIRSGELFGVVLCDVEVPEDKKEYFKDMPPIFKNILVGREHIGSFMRGYAEKNHLLTQPRQTLVGSYYGKNILLATPLLKWYLEHGVVLTNIEFIAQYEQKIAFDKFAKTVVEARREGDKDKSKLVLGESMKLLGNAAYGKTITNLERHTDTSYTLDRERASKMVNEKGFRKMNEIPLSFDGDDKALFELEMANKTINWNLPLQIGFFVYQYAKLRMLEFYFDCIDKFIDREDFDLCEMDTDSLYLAISSSKLEDVVKDKVNFYTEFSNWFPAQSCEKHQSDFYRTKVDGKVWEMSECCRVTNKMHQRTPGLFKTEFEGTGMISLCSKTYYCFGDDRKYKLSCKGLDKSRNSLNKDDFMNVLETGKVEGGINIGFKTNGSNVVTYSQERDSLSYLYIKRQVKSCGIRTVPLNI